MEDKAITYEYPADEVDPNNNYFGELRRVEEQFISQNIDGLNAIHKLWKEKEMIMAGEYSLKNPTPENIELAIAISDYLGYKRDETPEKKLA